MPVLPASDGKNYEFPEGTTADVAIKFLNSKGLSLRLPSAGQAQPGAANFDPQNPMAGVPASSMPVGRIGGRMVTQQDVAGMQAAAKTGEKVMREGVGTAAMMAPFAVAAPFTAGQSLTAGAGIMGLAGMSGGALSQVTDWMMGGEKKSPGKIASEVVTSGIFGAGTELGLGLALKYGGRPFADVLLRAANKSAKGQAVLTDMTQEAYGALNESVKGRVADPTPVYRAFLRSIDKIPVGEGPVVSKLAGKIGGTVGDLVSQVRAALEKDPLIGLPEKPLELLIRMHSEANQIAFSPLKDVPAPARAAAKDFANDLRTTITSNLNPAERKLFEAAKAIDRSQREFSAGQQLSRFLVRKALVGSIGALAGGGPGAAASVAGDAAFQLLEQKAAPAILEHMIAKNKTAYQQAIKLIHENPEELPRIASGMKDALLRGIPTKAFTKAMSAMFPQEAPNAAEARP